LAIIDHGRIVALDTPASLKRVLGGDIITLGIKAPKLEALSALGFVDKIDRQDTIVRLTVRDAKSRLPRILEAIGAVDWVEVHPATLDDVFMHYTGHEIRDTAEEGGWAERTMRYRSATR
jgi:ABC-2 type transport system ATP-binding protein